MGIFSDDTWTVGTADQDGQPIIIRVRSRMPDAAARQGHGQLIVVAWPYDGVATGLPATEDSVSMQAFEDAVAAGIERSGVGVQVASLTGAGHKEWRYYAADADAFVAALNASLEGQAAYPLEIEMFDDAEWQGLQQLLDGLDEDGEGDEDEGTDENGDDGENGGNDEDEGGTRGEDA